METCCRQSLTMTVVNYSCRASGIVNLVDDGPVYHARSVHLRRAMLITRFDDRYTCVCRRKIFQVRSFGQSFRGRTLNFEDTQISFLPSDFYRAKLCMRGTSHGPLSVCLSQVGVLLKRLNAASRKQHHTIAQGRSFLRQRSPRNSTGVTPYGGTKCRWGGS